MKSTLTLIALGILALFFLANGYSIRRQYRNFFKEGNRAMKKIENELEELSNEIEVRENLEKPKESKFFIESKFYSYFAFLIAGWIFSILFFLSVLSEVVF